MLYRCVRSGRTVEFNDPEDIEQMKTNESYIALEPYPTVEVSTHSQGEQDGLRKKEPEVTVENTDAPSQVKKRGRPKKADASAVSQDWV